MTSIPDAPTAMMTAELIVSDLMAAHPELPLRAEFYRGINRGNTWNPIRHQVIETDAVVGGWFVLLKPTLFDVVLSAWEPDILGGGIVGGLGDDAEVTPVHYPRSGHEVDVAALNRPEFRDELLAAIRVKVAVVEEAQAKR